jgi:hypothetical protein
MTAHAPAAAGRSALHPAVARLATVGVLAAGAAYLYRTDPHQPGHWLPRCPFNQLTGLLCPVCGGTRMAYDLMHRHFVAAWHDNAALLLVSPVIAAVFGRWVVEGLYGGRRRPRLRRPAVAAVVALAVAWAVVRNVW